MKKRGCIIEGKKSQTLKELLKIREPLPPLKQVDLEKITGITIKTLSVEAWAYVRNAAKISILVIHLSLKIKSSPSFKRQNYISLN